MSSTPAPDPSTGPSASGHRSILWRIIQPPLPVSEMTPAQRWYDSVSSVPMFIVAVAWLVSTFFTWSPALSPEYRQEGVQISVMTWLIFAMDLTIRFLLDPRKGSFLKRNWPFCIALAFPPLRILLVIAAVMRVARDRNALAKIVGLYAIYAVTFVVIFGALFTLMFEINAPNANITSFGDATWWAFVTVTTVGYGDFTPITVGGRVIAVLIMFTGAAAVGAVTAAVASRFINAGSSSSASETTSQDAQSSHQSHKPVDPHPSPVIGPTPGSDDAVLDDVRARLRDVQERVESIARSLDAALGSADDSRQSR